MTPSTTKPSEAMRRGGRYHCLICDAHGAGREPEFFRHYLSQHYTPYDDTDSDTDTKETTP